MSEAALHVSLDGFCGPLDLLLDLARAQKIDFSRISVVSLVDQYLAALHAAAARRLELAADWLVMAAWLTWLKSRLLLPPETAEAEAAGQSAELLAARLAELGAMRAAAAWLGTRPVLGRDVFARGAPENFSVADRSGLRADLSLLLRAYVDAIRRGTARASYQPKQLSFWSVQDALARLSALLGEGPAWADLEKFLPPGLSGQEHRAAVASTLLASLELARGGTIRLRQDSSWAPILLAPARERA